MSSFDGMIHDRLGMPFYSQAMIAREFSLFFPLLLLLPLLLGAFSWLKSIKYRSIEFRHLGEFYLSLSLMAAASRFLIPIGPAFIVLSMIPWVWTLRTFGLLTGDICKYSFFTKLHLIVLFVGGLTSLIFLAFNFTVSMVTAPFALGIALTGLTFVFQVYAKGNAKDYSPLQHFNFFLILAYFGTRLLFPLLITDNDSDQIQILIDTFLMITFSSTMYPVFAEIVFEKQEKFLEEVLHTRNKQLFSHSGFSEYRILAAGITHEVNNALLIVNTKLALLLRKKSTNEQQDLMKIQQATNRIVKSMRGLREFIYPHDVLEVLDLGDIASEVLSLYGQRLANHEVKVEVSSLENRLVKGHRIQLEQVFLSLISNSVDAIDELDEKWIKITSRGSEDFIEITYEDSSPSKAEDVMSLLSNPFYTSEKLIDSDIRLVLAKEIIEKHGGSLRSSPMREHMTFIIVLPLSEAVMSTDMTYKERIEEFKELH